VFVFNRPLSAVAAGLGVALLILCLDRLSHALESPHDGGVPQAQFVLEPEPH
jgi:hypothetical protein